MSTQASSSIKQVAILSGGTGGHIAPAIQVAEALVDQNIGISWYATMRPVDRMMLSDLSYDISYMDLPAKPSGLKGIFWWIKLLKAVFLMMQKWRKAAPDCVIGFGGYPSFAGLLAARLLNIPYFLQEQNAVLGRVNRLFAKQAVAIFTGFPLVGPKHLPVKYFGNPVHRDFLRQNFTAPALSRPLKILCLGGSQGAKLLNTLLPAALAKYHRQERVLSLHQTGPSQANQADAVAAYQQHGLVCHLQSVGDQQFPGAPSSKEVGVTAKAPQHIVPFLNTPAAAYHWADIIIARAGAMTLAESVAAAKPMVLIPFSAAMDDHQTKNADYLVEQNAAISIPESSLSVERLSDAIKRVSEPQRYALMVEAIQSLKTAQASEQIAAHVSKKIFRQ